MLSLEAAQQKISALKLQISQYDYQYYVLDAPTVADSVYDGLYRQLVDLETQFPEMITSDSPTQRVGGRAAVTLFNRSLRELKVDWESFFVNKESKYHVTIKPFYGPEDRLVLQDNACGPFAGCEQIIDGENHVMIVKPSDTNHSAYTKLRVQVDSMTDRIHGPTFAKRSPPSSKEEQKLSSILVPSNPTTEPKRLNDGATLLRMCGRSSFTKRPEEEFVGRWVSLANLLYKKRKEDLSSFQWVIL